jgi:hypothetical protein
MASSNGGSRKGPTISWSMLKGKKVKSNDGKPYGGIDGYDGELWFGRPIEQKKLQQWINDLISWTIYSRYRNLN